MINAKQSTRETNRKPVTLGQSRECITHKELVNRTVRTAEDQDFSDGLPQAKASQAERTWQDPYSRCVSERSKWDHMMKVL